MMISSDFDYPVKETLFYKDKYDGEWMPENLTEAIAWLQGFLKIMPVEFEGNATIEINSDEYCIGIDISYGRPATEAEIQKRRTEWQHRLDAREKKERQKYERLKAKFENSS